MISTFEDGTGHATFGAGWDKSTDSLFGGNSTVDYKVAAGGANGTAKSLQVSGEIIAGFQFPWAGPLFSPGERPFAPANLSKATGLQFWAKGDGKTYRVLYFTESGGSIPQQTTFVAGPEWKHYSIPFSTFADSDGHDVAAILFTAGRPPGNSISKSTKWAWSPGHKTGRPLEWRGRLRRPDRMPVRFHFHSRQKRPPFLLGHGGMGAAAGHQIQAQGSAPPLTQ